MSSSPRRRRSSSDRYLPQEIISSVLARVPAGPLLRFTSISSTLRSLANENAAVDRAPALLIRNKKDNWIFSVPLERLTLPNDDQMLRAIAWRALFAPGARTIPGYPVAFGRGLILISQFNDSENWILWSRMKGEFQLLPEIDTGLPITAIGVGYDNVTKDFKVMTDVGGRSKERQTFVYSLESGSWKTIDDDILTNWEFEGSGVFVEDSLYWIGTELKEVDMFSEDITPPEKILVAFDLSNEIYKLIELPLSAATCAISLLAVNDRLIVTYCYSDGHFIGRIMENYQGKNTWKLIFSFSNLLASGCKVIGFCNEKLLVHDGMSLSWLDMESGCANKFRIDGLPENFDSRSCEMIVCTESVFGLDQKCNFREGQRILARTRLRILVGASDASTSH